MSFAIQLEAIEMNADDAPIMVSGLGRSGTTWMQFLLSVHPRIHIHGQIPNLPWAVTWNWYKTLIRHGDWAQKSNRCFGYTPNHFTGSDSARCAAIFKRMYRDYMTGFGRRAPRWGLKALTYCADAQLVHDFESLWRDTRWVVCIRDPFCSIESAINTFTPNADPIQGAQTWVQVCRFIESHDPRRVVTVQIDVLSRQGREKRRAAIRRVMECIGEEPSLETDEFIRTWQVVHKVKSESARTFKLSDEVKLKMLGEVPDFAAYLEKWGYSPRLGD